MYCGQLVVRKKREKKKEIKVPKPRQLASGAWNIELRKEGESITEATPEECTARAQAIRAGYLKTEKAPQKQVLKDTLRDFIDAKAPVLSPATTAGYESIYKTRFQKYMDEDIRSLDWQELVNSDAADAKPKTVRNDWGLISAALRYAGLPVPQVTLPRVVQQERDFFDYQQILTFLDAVRGRKCELLCILALHSLRMSEILALTKDSLVGDTIQVRGAMVRDKDYKYVFKEANKTDKSRRDVPVMIPRLTELWPKKELVFQKHSAANSMLEDVCVKAGLPVLTMHELRHSFASLAWHLKWDIMTTCLIGGWNDESTVRKIYTHLAEQDRNDDVERMKEFYNGNFTNEITNAVQPT